MAVAAARVDDLERGDLPAICAKTGVPCDGLVKDTLRVVPRWVSPLAILLIVPYFVARAYAVAAHRGEAARSRRTRMERIRRLVRVAWIALVVAAAGLRRRCSSARAWSALVAFVAGLVAYLVIVYVGDQMWVGARPSRRDDVVILTRVHPEFARALAEQYADGSSARAAARLLSRVGLGVAELAQPGADPLGRVVERFGRG